MGAPLRVLVLEDHSSDAELMIRELRRAGFDPSWERVETEADYAARLAQFPDVILADFHLPQFDGLRALHILQARGLDIPLLVVTGSISEEVAVECIKRGASDYLLKDRLTRLGPAVTQALERKASREAHRRADARIRHLNEVLRAIRRVNQLIVQERDPERLLAGACASLVQTRGYRLVWIGRVEAGQKRVLPVARAGEGADYLDNILVTWDESDTGRGPTGTALRTRQPATIQDLASDPQFSLCKEAALAHGFASAASVPVGHANRLFGALTVYADQPQAFDDEEIGFLVELADDLGLALRSIEDETARKRQEDDLRLQGAALEAAANAIVITNREGNITWVNPAFTRLTGYAIQEVLGQNPRLLRSGSHDQSFYQNLWGTLLAGGVWQGEMINRRKDGSLYTEEMTITPVPDPRGEITHFISIKQDVTERRRAEEEIRTTARFPSENPDPVLRISHEGTVLYANDASGAMLQDWGCAVGSPVPSPWREVIRESLETGSRRTLDIPCGWLVYSTFVAPFPDAGYVNLYARDITERKQAEEALAARTLQLEAVRAVSVDITRELDLATLLGLIFRRVGELIGTGAIMVWFWDEAAQVLVPQIWNSSDAWRGAVRLRLGEGVGGTVAQRREGLLVNDYRNSTYSNPVFLERTNVTAVMGEPLLYGDRLLGAITVDNADVGRSFTEQDREILSLLVTHVAIAIENARLFETTRRVAHEARSLYEVAQSLTTSLDPMEVLHLIAVRTMELLGTPHAQVALWDEATQTLRLATSYGSEAETVKNQQFRLGEGVNGIVAQTREPLVVNDYQTFPQRMPGLTQVAADIGVPLLYRNRFLGVLNAHTTEPGSAFTKDHLALLTGFANQAAIAIENARLYQEIRQHAAILEQRVQERTQALAAANTQLQEGSRRKSEFLANMSHELRTPLNSILGFAQILMEQTAETLSPKQTRFLTNIYNSGQHLLQLINDILDLSKVEAGKFVLQPERLHIAETLEDILVIARGLANKKGQTIQVESAPNLPWLQADPVRFKQILFNLLSNAVKFTPERGMITVTARIAEGIPDCQFPISNLPDKSQIGSQKSKMLEIAVTDTGIGIRAEDIHCLFQEFVQLETTRAQHHEGTGLGLALTKRLVELHGGRIRAESGGEGKGSTFRVLLPLTAKAS